MLEISPHSTEPPRELGFPDVHSLLAALVQSSDDAIISKSLDGIITSWNPAAERLFGYSSEEMIGRSIETLIPPEHRAEEPMILSRIREGKKIDHYHTIRVRADGSRIRVALTISPVHDSRGRIVGASKILRPLGAEHDAVIKLRQLEEDYRISFELAAVGQSQMDPHTGRFLRINRKFCEITGYSEEELLALTFQDITHEADRTSSQEALGELLSGKTSDLAREKRYIRKDGTTVWVRVSSALLRNPLGKPVRILAVVEDISERRATQDRLARYREIFANSNDGIAVITPTGQYLEQNAAHQRLLGYSDDELRGRTPALHLGDEFFAQVASSLAQDGAWRGEGMSTTRSGRQIPIELSAFAVRDASGAPVCYVGIKRDISERKQVEEELRGRIEDLQAIYRMTDEVARATAPDGVYSAALDLMQSQLGASRASILLFDPDGVMRFKAWRRLSDSYRAAVEGHSPWSPDTTLPKPILVPDVLEDPALAPFRETISGEGIRALAFIPLVYEGRLLGKFMLYYDVPHHFTDREVGVAHTVANTIAFALHRTRTEAHLAQKIEELARSNRDLENFAYVTSHDLKEPLRGICSHAGFLLEDHGSELGPEGRQRIERLVRLTHRMYELLDSLLDYSRVGRRELSVQLSPLAAIVEESLEPLRDRIVAEKAEVTVAESLPILPCDALLVRQIIANLVVNALKYNTSPVKRVHIGWDAASQALYVRDNGIGIPPNQVDAIFRMFKRLHVRDAFGGGTGVGLAIVKRLVERHDGRIWVQSTPNEGSTFYFTLGGNPGQLASFTTEASNHRD